MRSKLATVAVGAGVVGLGCALGYVARRGSITAKEILYTLGVIGATSTMVGLFVPPAE